jgi:hypothetical protein
MEYDDFKGMLQWQHHIVSMDNPDDDYFNMSLQDFLDDLFWAADAEHDDKKWIDVPRQKRRLYSAFVHAEPVEFTDGTNNYTMKLVSAENDTVKVGAPLWWTTPTIRDKYYKADWDYATQIEITRQGDADILRVWQTYGEPHGSWEWDLQKLGNPMAINQLRFK